MDNAVYVMLSKQAAQFRQLDTIANNIANAETPSFKKELMIFTNYTTDAGKGRKLDFAQDIAQWRDTADGHYSTTGNMFDVALKGNAYLVVETPLGKRYTRAGNLQLDGTRTLVTAQGYPVLDTGDQHITFLEEDKVVEFKEDGYFFVDKEERGNLQVVSFPDEQLLQLAGESLYKSDVDPDPADPADFRMYQGVVEGSNVDPTREITDMITTSRLVDNTARFISSAYDLENKAIGVLARMQ